VNFPSGKRHLKGSVSGQRLPLAKIMCRDLICQGQDAQAIVS